MRVTFLRLLVIAVLWWAVIWFVLPVGWLQGSLPSFAFLHIAPPLLAEAAWRLFKRIKARKELRAKASASEIAAAEQQAARSEHQKALNARRAHLECRGVWAAVSETPGWYGGESKQYGLYKHDKGSMLRQNENNNAVFVDLLKQVLEPPMVQCSGVAWLPVYMLSTSQLPAGMQADLLGQAWRQAAKACDITHTELQPVCEALPGSGDVVERLIALFDNDPTLPALILVGVDTPSKTAQQIENSESWAGSVVVALLLSRPGLKEPDEQQIASSERGLDPNTPHWEQEQESGGKLALEQQGMMPMSMQPAFFRNLPPLAKLHRTDTTRDLPAKQKERAQQLNASIQKVLIHAGLREPPLESGGTQAKQAEPGPEPTPLELGWLAHNAGPDNLGSVFSALVNDFGCELDLLTETSCPKSYGDTGMACGTLMLAEALIRAAQLQKPVMVARFEEGSSLTVGLTCPVTQKASTNTKTSGQALEAAA